MTQTATLPTPLHRDTSTDYLALATQTHLANMQSLYRKDPTLAARVDAVSFSDLPPLEFARDGTPTLLLRADDGRDISVHSRFQPRDEARKFVAALPPAENPTFIVHGLGLGYHILELEHLHARAVFLVAEEDPAVIKAAFAVSDLAAIIREGRLIFLASTDRAAMHDKLNICNADLLLGIQFVTPPHSKRCRAGFHERMRAAILDFVSFARMQIVTLLRTSRITFSNIARNLPSYLDSRGVEPLRDAARGFPAVIVSAGPSLARNVRQLAAMRDRCVIICVQTAYKTLLSLGIQPHFVTSLDFHEVSAEFFRDAAAAPDCILIAEPKATPTVLELFPGPQAVLHHRFIDALLQADAPPRGGLRAGATVAHLSYYLAEHLGCDPIAFIGQDLAYSEGLFYMPGSPIEQIWQPELGRYQTMEMKQWDRIARNRSILRRTRDLHGRDVYTDDLLFTYAEQFQKDFTAGGRRVIQASEGGLALSGMEIMSLRDVAARYGSRPLPANLFDEIRNPAAPRLRELAESQLQTRLAELAEMRTVASKMQETLKRLVALLDRPAEFNRLVARVDELRIAMGRFGGLYQLVIDVSASADLRRHHADRRLSHEKQETVEVARRRLDRDLEFVAAFLDGCAFLASVLPDAIARLARQMSHEAKTP